MRFRYTEENEASGAVLLDRIYTEQEAVAEFGDEGFVWRYGGQRPFAPGFRVSDEGMEGVLTDGRPVSLRLTYEVLAD